MIAAGHRFNDLQHYTLEQIEMFSAAINTAKAEQIKNNAIAARAAQADKKDFQKFMRG